MQVAACELLHSLVIYMIGKSAQMADVPSSLPPMYNLHKKLFPVLLRLACDVDQVSVVCVSVDLNEEEMCIKYVVLVFRPPKVCLCTPFNLSGKLLGLRY